MHPGITTPATRSDLIVPKGFFATAGIALRRFGFLGTVGRWAMQESQIGSFLAGATSQEERLFRRRLVKRFGAIQRNVPCAHAPHQMILVATHILERLGGIDGPIIQCGCWKGGSTAKLSLVAARVGRQLVVCDSFGGLPPPEAEDDALLRGSMDLPDHACACGEYAGRIEEVKDHVGRYGDLAVCRFVPGLFKETLPQLDVAPSVVFIDVDYISSARECLRHLWPRLASGGFWFTHEASFLSYLQGMMDPGWWHQVLGQCPPLVLGAGTGLSAAAPSLACFQKTG